MNLLAWSGLVAVCAGLQTPLGHAADLQTIVQHGTATIQSDWAADPEYAYVERDEVQHSGKVTSKTYQVVMIAGSDYHVPIATNDERLTPFEEHAELRKLRDEVERRNHESASARQQRIANYKKQTDENGELLLNFPNSFNFKLEREETMNGHPAYVLSGTPKKKTGTLSRAAKVLAGMNGIVWIDKEHFHAIRAECNVMAPVPLYGILATVLPGTRVEFQMEPVSDSIWLIHELSMDLAVAKLRLFKSAQVTRTSYSQYRLNSSVVDELMSKVGQPTF